MISYDELIDDLMLHFSQPPHDGEAQVAKNEFHKLVGIFDEDAVDLGNKINLFIDWYIFSRPMSQRGESPIKTLDGQSDWPIRKDLLPFASQALASKASLFELIKVKGEDLYVKDLFSDYKMVMKKSPFTIGFSKNEIFSARIFPYEDTFMFSKSFCIHPVEAQKYILKEIKKIKKMKLEDQYAAREDLIFRLLKMRFKIDQYKHLKIQEIYAENPKLKI